MGVRALPIGSDEFARMFRKCIPPVGWRKNIAVANSGGPDSTCLLFLIHRYLSNKSHASSQELPDNVLSFTVDHDLQATSAAMAEHSSTFAKSLGLQHITSKVNWSQPPFPPRPTEGQPFEAIARTARYQSLFQAMTQKDVGVIAFGHHADDQVETSLIRLSWGSTATGAGGMRPCRRWGMGVDQGGQDVAYGYEGMNRWIVRPLLAVGKERILATCEENNLEYVTDATNFQPSATLRNAIRHIIHRPHVDGQHGVRVMVNSLPWSSETAERLRMAEATANSLKNVSMSLESSIDELRSGVSVLTSNVQDIDDQVDSILRRSMLRTLPGTFLMSSRAFGQIRDPTISRALILRIMRYISYHPWGSTRADAGRRKTSISQIAHKLNEPLNAESTLRPFTAGGGVLWTPVLLRQNSIRIPPSIRASDIQNSEQLGWLASRQPPMNRLKLQERGLPNHLEIDITSTIVKALRDWRGGGSPVVPILYDCRFLVRFSLEKMPARLMSRLLDPHSGEKMMFCARTRWYWPSVVWEADGTSEVLHAKISEDAATTHPFLDERQLQIGYKHRWTGDWSTAVDSGWINMEWIRPLTAL
ncbi:PP-loop family-domain-containing protein [Lyophyllum atratum]|nr:PP-loop family-domain-containing protein [Lyophyllum atratum]